jgi:hypothetical protein
MQGYKVVSVIERDEDRAKDKVRMYVRTRIREWEITACEYYGMDATDDFPFETHRLVVSDPNEVYEHLHS